MERCFGKMLACLFAFVALLASIPQVKANVVGITYPNSSIGPYYMETNTRVFDPPAGSKWAFGMFNNCSVPHLAVNSWYASSRTPSVPMDRYAGSGSFEAVNVTWHDDRYIDYGYWSGWSPPYPGGSFSEYMPEYGQYGRGTPIYWTTYPGWTTATASGNITSLTQYYYNASASAATWSYCCQNGTGC